MEPECREGIFMTIRERLRRSNLIMLVVPIVLAGIVLAAGQ